MHKITPEEYKKRFDAANSDNKYELLSPFENTYKKVLIKHLVCGREFFMSPFKFTHSKRGCSYCVNQGLTHEEFVDKFKDHYGGYRILGTFMGFNKPLSIEHITCGTVFQRKPAKFHIGQKCTSCNSSALEAHTAAFLSINSITYKKEYSFKNPHSKGHLRFDFAIFNELDELIHFIECDGIQHFEEKYSRIDIRVQHRNDDVKNSFAKIHNIPLLRIKYDQIKDIFQILAKEFGTTSIPTPDEIHTFMKRIVSPNQARQVRIDFINGKSVNEIGVALGVGKSYINPILNYKTFTNQDLELREEINKRRSQTSRKLNFERFTKNYKFEIIQLRKNGWTWQKIADKYNVHPYTVKTAAER